MKRFYAHLHYPSSFGNAPLESDSFQILSKPRIPVFPVLLLPRNGDVEKRTGMNKVEGEGPVVGLMLDLTYVWDRFTD